MVVHAPAPLSGSPRITQGREKLLSGAGCFGVRCDIGISENMRGVRIMRTRWAPTALVLALLAGAAVAQDPVPNGPVERKALDDLLQKTLKKVINDGANLYNGG